LCNVGRTPGSLFCGTHKPNDEDCGSRATKKSKYKDVKVERIPCPLDPSHSIYKHDLDKHLKICNIKTNENKMEKELFFCLNCNSGYNMDNNDNNNNKDNHDNNHITDNSHNDNDFNTNNNDDNSNDNDSMVCPDLLLLKIEKCYNSLVDTEEFSLLIDENDSHDDDDDENDDNDDNDNNKNENNDDSNSNNDSNNYNNGCYNNDNDKNDNNGTTLASISKVSYNLLESRITAAVSGTYTYICVYMYI
jgi:hypothetical protein